MSAEQFTVGVEGLVRVLPESAGLPGEAGLSVADGGVGAAGQVGEFFLPCAGDGGGAGGADERGGLLVFGRRALAGCHWVSPGGAAEALADERVQLGVGVGLRLPAVPGRLPGGGVAEDRRGELQADVGVGGFHRPARVEQE
jgi:hypothetical protein